MFPGVQGLKDFATWVHNADRDELINHGTTCGSKQKISKQNVLLLSDLNKFKYEHRRARRRWRLNEGFPSKAVVDAYMHPRVNASTEEFSWSTPDVVGLRIFMNDKLGWEESQVNQHLLPVMRELSQKKSAQTRIDGYFTTTYKDDKRAAKFQSKRLIQATKALKRRRDQEGMTVEQMLKAAPAGFDEGTIYVFFFHLFLCF